MLMVHTCTLSDVPDGRKSANDYGASGSDSCLKVPASSGWGPKGEIPLRAEIVADGLEIPWSIGFLPDGDMLVTERPGRIRLIQENQLLGEPVARLEVDPGGEGGLLGLALHPQFEANRYFFLYRTVGGGKNRNRVERWRLGKNNRNAAYERTIIDSIPASLYHNGGRLRFGPDGMLYVGTGDARKPEFAQKIENLAGKILRVTPEGEIPQDNPFPGHAAYIIGIRNIQGFDWREDGAMYICDHGPSGEMGRSGADEINVARAGANLGWPRTYLCQNAEGMIAPSMTFEKALPPGGAVVYVGDKIERWKGSLIIGTLGSRHLHQVSFYKNSPVIENHSVYFEGDEPKGYGRLREVIMSPEGDLYVTTSNCDGRGACPDDKDKILRILPE